MTCNSQNSIIKALVGANHLVPAAVLNMAKDLGGPSSMNQQHNRNMMIIDCVLYVTITLMLISTSHEILTSSLVHEWIE